MEIKFDVDVSCGKCDEYFKIKEIDQVPPNEINVYVWPHKCKEEKD